MADVWAVLWSQRQNSLHVEPIQQMYRRNRDQFVANRAGDYVLMFSGTQQEADDAAESLRGVLMRRDAETRAVGGARAA